MHVDVSRAYFHAKAQRLVLVKLPAEDCSGNWTVEEEHVRYQRCSKQLGTKLARASGKLGLRAGAQFKKLVPQQEKKNLRFYSTHGDDSVVTGTKGSLLELKMQLESVDSIKSGAGLDKEYQGAESEKEVGERYGYCINTITDTLTFSSRVWGSRMGTQCKLQQWTT